MGGFSQSEITRNNDQTVTRKSLRRWPGFVCLAFPFFLKATPK